MKIRVSTYVPTCFEFCFVFALCVLVVGYHIELQKLREVPAPRFNVEGLDVDSVPARNESIRFESKYLCVVTGAELNEILTRVPTGIHVVTQLRIGVASHPEIIYRVGSIYTKPKGETP